METAFRRDSLPRDGSERAILTPISEELAPMVVFELPKTIALSVSELAPWVHSIQQQIRNIQALSEGWDGYGAGPIRRDVLILARQLLFTIMRADTPPPHIAPMSHEGIQLEWNKAGIELEIEIESPGKISVIYKIEAEEIENEWEISSDFKTLLEPIERLSEQT